MIHETLISCGYLVDNLKKNIPQLTLGTVIRLFNKSQKFQLIPLSRTLQMEKSIKQCMVQARGKMCNK